MSASARTLRLDQSARRSLPGIILGYLALARERRALTRLDDQQLADIGRTRAEAAREACRPFWDMPRNRC